MPRLLDKTMENSNIAGLQAFKFSALRIEHLGASEYTLVTIAIDESGSLAGLRKELEVMLVATIDSCKKSPRSNNLLVRVIKFSGRHPSGVLEVHGFKALADINTADYSINPGGETPLCDATFSAIGATNEYGTKLANGEFLCNAIIFIITDGEENASTSTMAMVQKESKKIVSDEKLESLITLLVGMNTQYCSASLKKFKDEAGLSQYVDMGDVTPRKLAKLAGFVSQSVSSQSQAIGSGGPSQNIPATI